MPARVLHAGRDRHPAGRATFDRSATPARVEHPIGDSDLLHIPIGLKAGFGELGRHGSIIHPRLGPLFRMGSVAVTLDLAIDHPIDAGIAKFCDACRACRKYLPGERDSRITAVRQPARITLATTATSSTPAAASRTSRSTSTARSACRCACTTTRSGRATSRASPRSCFRRCVMEDPPPPADLPDESRLHWYPRIGRS